MVYWCQNDLFARLIQIKMTFFFRGKSNFRKGNLPVTFFAVQYHFYAVQ
jgi:hypothetical protein